MKGTSIKAPHSKTGSGPGTMGSNMGVPRRSGSGPANHTGPGAAGKAQSGTNKALPAGGGKMNARGKAK